MSEASQSQDQDMIGEKSSSSLPPTAPTGNKVMGTAQDDTKKRNQGIAELNEAYLPIAKLLTEIDKQSAEFSGGMNRILGTAPTHDSLAALWEEQTQVLRIADSEPSESTNQQTSRKAAKTLQDASLLEEDTDDDPADQLIFL